MDSDSTDTVHWVDVPDGGRIGIFPHPDGGTALGSSLEALRGEGVDVLVSALEPDESLMLGLGEEAAVAQRAGLEFHALPIPDWGVPRHPRPVIELAETLAGHVSGGRSVAIHCRAGIGRSAVLAATALVRLGWEPTIAFERLSKARGLVVPATPEQRAWVETHGRPDPHGG